MDKGFEIADIIVAFIKGEVTSRQISLLDQWISESKDNEFLFLSLLDESMFEQRLREQEELELKVVFEQIKARKKRRSKRSHLKRIMVAASIVVLLAITGIITYLANTSDFPDTLVRQEFESIDRNRAYLTLATGEKVILGKCDTLLWSNVTSIYVQREGQVSYEVMDTVLSTEIEYNTMETPRGAEFQLTLSDGTKVWLNAESKLQFPVNFVGKERRVQLTGEAYFDVYRDENTPFIVETTCSEVTVLGTEFCVKDYAGQTNQTTLVEGSVSVRDHKGDSYLIKPGQQVNIDGDSVRIADVETIYFTSWKDGYFIFNQATLGDIMGELSKWYDFDYFFMNTGAMDLRLTARLKKYDDISVVMDILSRTGDIYFSRKGRVIIIGEYQ